MFLSNHFTEALQNITISLFLNYHQCVNPIVCVLCNRKTVLPSELAVSPAFQYIPETAVLLTYHIGAEVGVTSENRRKLIQFSENQRLFKVAWKLKNGEGSLGI